jgi:hypothetical protein
MSEWTKGPVSRGFDYFEECRVEFEGSGHYITISTPGRKLPVAFVIGTPGRHYSDDPEQEANANLYAAAPTMAEALEALLDAAERHIFSDECRAERDAARAALSLAKGEDHNG